MGSRPGTTGRAALLLSDICVIEEGCKMVDGSIVVLCLCLVVSCTGYETVNTTQIKIENNSGQRDYQQMEEGKVLPFRTFLTTAEIIIICIATVILFILLVLLIIIYLCVYGCVLPNCCRRQSKEYSQVQLNREKKISEIWK